MPVFHFDFNRSCTHLDMSAARSGIFTPALAALEIGEEALNRFNTVVMFVDSSHAGFTADQIAGAARRVLRAASRGQESAFIKVRMRRAGEMRAALRDSSWEMASPVRAKIKAIVDYLDENASALIDNQLPVVGQLDDAILVDVAMDALRDELDEYADFCRFRVGEASRHDLAPHAVMLTREQWMSERAQERRLEQQLKRVRGSSYARGNVVSKFRIC